MKSIKKIKEVQITSIKRNASIKVPHSQENEENQIFTLQVKGKTNFQILSKLRDALELQQQFTLNQNLNEAQKNLNKNITNDPVVPEIGHQVKIESIEKYVLIIKFFFLIILIFLEFCFCY